MKISAYHGTFSKFKDFDKCMLGKFTGAPSSYEGFFFASNKKVAESYASDLTKQLRELNAKAEEARSKIKELTGDSWGDATFKIYRKEYDIKTDKKIRSLLSIIQKDEDLEAGLQDCPMAYGEELDKSGVIKKTQLDFKNPLIHDMKGEDDRNISYYDLIKQAKSKGHDSVIIKNTYDGANPVGGLEITDIFVAFDESQIKTQKNIKKRSD